MTLGAIIVPGSVTMLAMLQKIQEIITQWWSGFTLQTRLMAGATLVVSLLISGFTFKNNYGLQ